jgi:acyl carrier protein
MENLFQLEFSDEELETVENISDLQTLVAQHSNLRAA